MHIGNPTATPHKGDEMNELVTMVYTNSTSCDYLYWNGRNYVSFSDFYRTVLSGYIYILPKKEEK